MAALDLAALDLAARRTLTSLGSFGSWEDLPRRQPGADVKSVPLDAREAFLLTRIDGATTLSELSAVSGLGREGTVEALERMRDAGLITVEGPRVSRGQRSGWADAAKRSRRGRSAGKVDRAAPDPDALREAVAVVFRAASNPDAVLLARRGIMTDLADLPLRTKAEPFGGHRFDRKLLARRSSLSAAQKREVLFVHANMEKLDLFECMHTDPVADRRELRRAYHGFSRTFHPDSHYEQDLGDFGPLMREVYRAVSKRYKVFLDDEALLGAYGRTLKLRNDTYYGQLEAAAKRVKDRAEQEERRRREGRAAERKADLRRRLKQRTSRRRATTNPMVGRIEKAKQFYQDGMAHYEGEHFVEAANELKLAMTYDPRNTRYKEIYVRFREKAQQTLAEQHWKRGYMQESVGRVKEALTEYLKACAAYERPDYLVRTAELMLEHGVELHHAASLAQKATEQAARNVDYLMILGRIYEEVKLPKKAIAVFERVLQIDKDHDAAKRAIRAQKRQ